MACTGTYFFAVKMVLSDTLKNLESDGLISRKIYAEIPPKVEYSLTDLGRSLMPHLTGLIDWAMTNYESFTFIK